MPYDFAGFIGRSKVMLRLYERIAVLARAPIPILLTGETGTGKELAAQSLRTESGSSGPFEIADCAALPETLIDSELFGHVRGAFTGAVRDHIGIVRRADGGDLFLDEIGELPLFCQAKLLRCVETGNFRPVGGERTRHSRFRLIAATNRDLQQLIGDGQFRADLLHRLGSASIRLPALREHLDDIPLLVEFFLDRLGARTEGRTAEGFDEAGMTHLMRYDWPGNVRQLRNVVEAAATIADDRVIDAPTLLSVLYGEESTANQSLSLETSLLIAEKRAIETALRAAGGNRDQAAAVLKVSPAKLYRRLAVVRARCAESTGEQESLEPPKTNGRSDPTGGLYPR